MVCFRAIWNGLWAKLSEWKYSSRKRSAAPRACACNEASRSCSTAASLLTERASRMNAPTSQCSIRAATSGIDAGVSGAGIVIACPSRSVTTTYGVAATRALPYDAGGQYETYGHRTRRRYLPIALAEHQVSV